MIVEPECCPVAAGCRGEVVDTVEPGVSHGEPVVATDHGHPPVATSGPTIESGPASIATSEPAGPGLETVNQPPTLEPAGGVEQASNEQPLPESLPPAEGPSEASVLTGEPGSTPKTPQEAPVDAEVPDATKKEPEQPPAPEAAPDAPVAGESTEDASVPGDGAEPPMEEDTSDAPAADNDEAPPAPAPAPEPEPANIFEEVEEEESQEGGPEPAEMPETSASVFDAPVGEPATPAGELLDEAADPAEPVADPAAPADPFAAGDTAPSEEMADDEGATPEEAASPDESADAPAEGTDAGAAAAEEPAPEAAADEPEPAEKPAAEADPFAAGEQPRRWIDATGTGSIVGTLVDVDGGDRCLLDVGGRRIIVPLEKLSDHDRDYVRRAGIRLAKLRGERDGDQAVALPAPAATETAGL